MSRAANKIGFAVVYFAIGTAALLGWVLAMLWAAS